jgi:anti-sigma B factor antagonist
VEADHRALSVRVGEAKPGWPTVHVEGEVDISTVDQLVTALDKAESEDRLLVDLSGVAFMDSTGLRALVERHQRFEESGRRLVLMLAPGPVTRLIELTGVDQKVEVVADVGELPD